MTSEINYNCWHVLLNCATSMNKLLTTTGYLQAAYHKGHQNNLEGAYFREKASSPIIPSLGFFKMSDARLGEDSCVTDLSALPCNIDLNARGSAFKTKLHEETLYMSHLITSFSSTSLQPPHSWTLLLPSVLTKESGHNLPSDSHLLFLPIALCATNSTLK